MQQNKKRAIIIGGGIGGITTAIALQRAGFEVDVFEQAPELREVGSGLPLWSNALYALHSIGLDEAIRAMGRDVSAGSVTTWQGKPLVNLEKEVLLKRLGTISIVVHRAELLTALLGAFDAEHVHLGAVCVGFTQDEHGICARFADGREGRGDLLIGADGLHSVIRTQLFGPTKPRYGGYICWRGIAHTDRTNLETWSWGRGCQFGVVPMSNQRAYWFAQYNVPEGQGVQPCGKKQELLNRFRDWHDPIPAMIEATDENAILHNDVYEGVALRHWSVGRVTLLGDAAHTMGPNLGQGACVAIEDAIVLASSLKNAPDIATGLQRYEQRRKRRTYTIRRLAHLIGKIVQRRNSLVTGPRNAIIKHTPVKILLMMYMWMLEYKAS
jgi:2-polyprenyl-6-methoxyphenol hydroxylase-like FAD-dependent oxidoreductase